jgi:hypothetical protein
MDDTLQRFRKHVDVHGSVPAHRPELGPCHLWTGALGERGYGAVRFAGKVHRAHRVAFKLEHGRWPAPNALHHCDNHPCVNPGHLFEGTNRDNTDDMIAKGRQGEPRRFRGEAHASTKLSDAAVMDIRTSTDTHTACAARHGCSYSQVQRIRAGVSRGLP